MPIHDDFSANELDIMRRVSGLPIDQLAMGVVSNIWRSAQGLKLRVERQVLREHGLTFASFSTLFIVWIWGPIETGDIARSQAVTKATITSTVSQLERQGLVQRRSVPNDKRRVLVELTAAGKNLVEWVFPKFNQVESEIASPLTAEEQETLARLLRRVVAQVVTEAQPSLKDEDAAIPEETA